MAMRMMMISNDFYDKINELMMLMLVDSDDISNILFYRC